MRYLVLITFLIGYLNSYSQLSVTSTPIDPICGMCDGSIIANASGGTPFTSGSPYLYSWNTTPIQTKHKRASGLRRQQ